MLSKYWYFKSTIVPLWQQSNSANNVTFFLIYFLITYFNKSSLITFRSHATNNSSSPSVSSPDLSIVDDPCPLYEKNRISPSFEFSNNFCNPNNILFFVGFISLSSVKILILLNLSSINLFFNDNTSLIQPFNSFSVPL